MSTTKFVRISGVAAIAAGVFTVAGTVLEFNPNPALVWIYMISTITTIVALTGLYLYQKVVAGTLGLVGFAVALLGNLLLFFPNPAIGGSVFVLGLVLIGVAMLRANSFSKWIPWLWIVAPVIAVFGFVLPAYQVPLFLFGAAASGLGFIGIGTKMWSSAEAV
jgi:hypothetical protein